MSARRLLVHLRDDTGLEALSAPGITGVLGAPGLVGRGLPASAGRPAERWAIVPDPLEYLRDSSEAGPVGAAVKRLRRARLGTLLRLAAQGVVHLPRILARDFAALLCVLVELELAAARPRRPSHVVLAAPWTDLALAARNHDFFASYARYIRRFHRARPCLETANGGHLLGGLRRWSAPIDAVLMPLNPRGHRMKPNAEACLREVRQASVAVLATDVTASGTVPVESAVAFAWASGASGVVVGSGEVAAAGLRRSG